MGSFVYEQVEDVQSEFIVLMTFLGVVKDVLRVFELMELLLEGERSFIVFVWSEKHTK